jgi:hypothetical protein
MPNEYAVDIHNWITEKIKVARRQIASSEAADKREELGYWNGQLEELLWLRDYFKQQVDLKGFEYYR